MRPRHRLTRRSLLGLALAAAAGCHNAVRRPASHPAPADGPALAAAARREQQIVAGYDEAIAKAPAARLPALQVSRALHATHLAALRDAGAGPVAAAAITPAHHLVRMLRQSTAELQQLAVNATSGAHAALLASIAASHEASAGA